MINLSEANRRRCLESFRHDHSIIFWAMAIAGKAGELANLIKKTMRRDFTLESKQEEILQELADIIIYADLAISFLGASPEEEVRKKFNIVSARVGSTIML